jgi:hypothetical protein
MYHSTVLGLFQPAVVQPLPKGVQEIARIDIRMKDQANRDIRLYWYGTSEAMFTVNGTPCIRGGRYVAIDGKDKYLDEPLAICGVLREINKLAKGAANSDVEWYIRRLEKCRGK